MSGAARLLRGNASGPLGCALDAISKEGEP